MPTVAARKRLKAALQEAACAAEAYREEGEAAFGAEMGRWRRVGTRRKWIMRRFADRMQAIDAAIDALRKAAAGL
jgi:hypothetical protein